jgi:hypothetical protein
VIVYGGAEHRAELSAFIDRLRQNVARLLVIDPSLDGIRTLLIQCGELEQAASDASSTLGSAALSLFEEATDAAAAALAISWQERTSGAGAQQVRDLLRRMTHALDQAPPWESAVTIKVPEGFAHYALYPEQYVSAARSWATEHPPGPDRRLLVVGIRSIGTTLSAVVAAALRQEGWDARRITVRPTGHPWDRALELSREEVGQPVWALVVDEGPGLSGSSMAAVAAALHAAGVDADRIAFFPGHGGEPGSAAPESSRAWWQRATRWVVPREALRWNGQSLPEALAGLVPSLCPEAGAVVHIEDLAGGQWRNVAGSRVEEWPPACAPFEPPKYRCVTAGGRAFLWKYHGLSTAPGTGLSAAEAAAQQLNDRAAGGWAQAALGSAFGFVLTEWTSGVPLSRDDLTAELQAHIGSYLAAVAGPALTEEEAESAWQRLSELLYWNTWEVLGEAAAARAAGWTTKTAASAPRQVGERSYGDGRLSPEHWLRTPEGRWIKTSSTRHDADHTAVGRQPLLWDVAGALVEWGITPETAGPLLQAVGPGAGRSGEMLTFYQMAYAAFRMGQCAMCAGLTGGDLAEQERPQRAAERYRTRLAILLEAT